RVLAGGHVHTCFSNTSQSLHLAAIFRASRLPASPGFPNGAVARPGLSPRLRQARGRSRARTAPALADLTHETGRRTGADVRAAPREPAPRLGQNGRVRESAHARTLRGWRICRTR